jgi:DNA-binding response OmpR family regulator
LKILIVDDDIDDRQLIGLAFKEAAFKHSIDYLRNGEELMNYLNDLQSSGKREQFPDLILLDLNMPKKDGRVALKEIRSDSNFNKLNVIILSTTISAEDHKFIMECGVIKSITKPCGFFELVDIAKDISNELKRLYPSKESQR